MSKFLTHSTQFFSKLGFGCIVRENEGDSKERVQKTFQKPTQDIQPSANESLLPRLTP